MNRFLRVTACVCATSFAASACSDANGIGEPVVVASAHAHSPTVALAAAGTGAYVAWVSGDSSFDVLLARVGADGSVSDAVRVNHIRGDAAPHAQAPAQVAVGPAGNVYVAWQNNTDVAGRRFPASDLRFARSTDGGRTFEPTIYVNDDAGGAPGSHTFHDLAVGDDGTVYVSWIDGRGGESGPEIRIARSTDQGRSFAPSVVVARGACPCCRTALATHGSSLYLGWRDVAEGSIRDVVVARSTDAGLTWSAPIAVHADGWRIDGCPHAGPALAVTNDGRLHAAWYTGAPDRPGLHYVTADSTLSFGEPRPLLTGEWVPPSLVSLAARDDRVVAAWDDRRTDTPRLSFARPQQADAAAHVDGIAPALDARSNAYGLAWLHGDSILLVLESEQ